MEYNSEKKAIVLCTKKDLRFYDVLSGRMMYSYSGLLPDPEDEICVFKSYQYS